MDLTSKGANTPLAGEPNPFLVWEKYTAELDASIAKITKITDQLNKLYESRLQLSFNPDEDTTRDVEINRLTAEIMQEFNGCQKFLADIKKKFKPRTPTERQIKQNFLRTKAKKMSDLLEQFHENEQQFEKSRDKLDEPLSSDKEKEKKKPKEVNIYEISTPDVYIDINRSMNRQLNTIRQEQELSSQEAVKQLNRDVISLASMFTDLANLVDEQGEQLDSIEHHIGISVNHFEAGNTDLQVAQKIQASSSKRGLICIIILIVIAFILSIVVYLQHK